jgi:hypothetical protein
MLEEVNRTAKELNLREDLPIARSNVVGTFVNPPAMFINRSSVGTLSTKNYEYYLTVGRTVSGIDMKRLDESRLEVKSNYWWTVDKLDTNAAFQIAIEIMKKAGADVDALNHECVMAIRASMPEGTKGSHFVPDYWVNWQGAGSNVASLEFVQPTKVIRSLHVYDAKYLRRKPLEIRNLDELLKQPSRPPETNSAASTNANGKHP